MKKKNRIAGAAGIAAVLLLLLIAAGCGTDSSPRILQQEVWLDSGKGDWIRAEAAVPAHRETDKLPLVTIGHGFRGNMDSAGGNYLSEALAKAGFAVIRMDYAHYRKQDPDTLVNQYTVDTMIEDQLTCIRYMIEHYDGDPDRIGLYGRSMGGRVAMVMANEGSGGYDYRALALVAPAGTAEALPYYMGGQEQWQKMKEEARTKGFITHQQVILTPEFFSSIEDNTPSQRGDSFSGPVLVIYNTEDYVVLPETSKACAAAYEHAELVEVTSEKSPHGYEMGFRSSALKDRLIGKITAFFEEALQ